MPESVDALKDTGMDPIIEMILSGFDLLKALILIWTVVGIGLACYLVGFPVFMKKNISVIVGLLERIAKLLEKKQGQD